jgi:lipopolysaccharide/colanic/teichoic acid biosynthesis glycosyltransferase
VPRHLGVRGSYMVSLRRAQLAPPISTTPEFPAPGRPRPVALASPAKRALDIVFSVVLLTITSPIWLVAAVLIKATSPGPVLFRQQRVGVGGRTFTCYKFRTMHHGASDEPHRELVTRMLSVVGSPSRAADGRPYKLHGDHRVIGVGRWLRHTSLDELPQLLNVLRGEMSIVGPRPAVPYEVDHYEDWQYERLAVRPGITGLWQVSGRNRLTFQEMCTLDIQYIHGWSLSRDLLIMLRTPWVMFVDGGGAS